MYNMCIYIYVTRVYHIHKTHTHIHIYIYILLRYVDGGMNLWDSSIFAKCNSMIFPELVLLKRNRKNGFSLLGPFREKTQLPKTMNKSIFALSSVFSFSEFSHVRFCLVFGTKTNMLETRLKVFSILLVFVFSFRFCNRLSLSVEISCILYSLLKLYWFALCVFPNL